MRQDIEFVGLSTMPTDRRIVACFRIDDALIFQGEESIWETVQGMPEKGPYKQAYYMINTVTSKELEMFPGITGATELLGELATETEH